jgi:hydrogenase/urease accessory protein HupE
MTSLASDAPAHAHGGGTMGYAQVTVQGSTVRYALTLGIDPAPPGQADNALAGIVAQKITISSEGRACAPAPGRVSPRSPNRASIVVTVDYACPGRVRELTLRDDLSDALGGDYHTLADIEVPGGAERYVFEAERREARFAVAAGDASADGSAGSGVLAFFRLGVEHILSGFDHLLFLLALVLRGGSIGALLAIVTAFTVAHSVTLALAVLDVVTLPAQLVEPAIALSIVYVALENIRLERPASRRWTVSFLFGLVHGFGFAGALMELGLPTGALVPSLLSFNAGVEVGQGMVVSVLLPALLWLRRCYWERRAVMTMSALVLTAGIVLLIERALLPGG